jgi:hypothetical protein
MNDNAAFRLWYTVVSKKPNEDWRSKLLMLRDNGIDNCQKALTAASIIFLCRCSVKM